MPRLSVDTKLGIVRLEYSAIGITSLMLPHGENSLPEADTCSTGEEDGQKNAEAASSLLKDYFEGEIVDFSNISVDLSQYSDFFQRVCQFARHLDYGQVATYGQVAQLAGSKNGARAVGRIMAKNPVPIIIPCHRVVASNGAMTGYSAAGGIATKKKLLIMEGIDFITKDRVRMQDK